jgi:hypothetical protein
MLRRTVPAILAVALLTACGSERTASACGGGAWSKLSVWSENARFGAAFELGHAPPRAPWRLVVVHEGRVVWRGSARTSPRGALKLVQRLRDYTGADHVTVRATGPSGRTCAASATLN